MEVFLIKALQLILSLAILVVLHELGHFIPAKIFKTRVEKFYLFFDVKFSLFKKKIGETVYGIGWLPLGGYVKISGMIDESFDKEQMSKPPQPWEFRSKPTWQRLIIMLGGVTVNLIVGFALYMMILFVWGKDYVPQENMPNGLDPSTFANIKGLLDPANKPLTFSRSSPSRIFNKESSTSFTDSNPFLKNLKGSSFFNFLAIILYLSWPCRGPL